MHQFTIISFFTIVYRVQKKGKIDEWNLALNDNVPVAECGFTSVISSYYIWNKKLKEIRGKRSVDEEELEEAINDNFSEVY